VSRDSTTQGGARKSRTERLRIAVVVPRLADRIFGGAELHALWLSRQLLKRGHSIEVLTTCAVDHYSWANTLPPGVERHHGLLVRRFRADERDFGVHGELERAIQSGVRLTREEELLWLRNGVSSTPMEEELVRHGYAYDAILALPYLFGTTYFSYASCPHRTVVIPCLHDEPYARLSFVADMLGGAMGLLWNSAPEEKLARRLQPNLAPAATVGLGFDPPRPVDVDLVRRKYRLPGCFMLYVGRLEGGKNVPLLVDYFQQYKNRRDTDLHLIVVGSGEVPVPRTTSIMRIELDWDDRDALYRASTIFCQPSRLESLSIVVMQAWLAERPVLVHALSPVTRFHCEQSHGGLWFSNYIEFEATVDRLLSSHELRLALGRAGRRYVQREYSWDAVLDRLETALDAWRPTTTSPAPGKADQGNLAPYRA
jgi:glycosyltransferase involved in cell wall biosynthesis